MVILWVFDLSAVQFTLSSTKFLVMTSTDDGTFVFILVFVGYKVETDVGINEGYVPDLIFGMLFVLCVLKNHIWYSLLQQSFG